MSRSFATVNERAKVQDTHAAGLAGPVADLSNVLAAPMFLDFLGDVFRLPDLLADDQRVGGGIHRAGPRGQSEVHVNFNDIVDRRLHRRLNMLIDFNQGWDPSWGAKVELWNRDVKTYIRTFSPPGNRCVVFETSDNRYHGVLAATCPDGRSRRLFAPYVYTEEAPSHSTGEEHS